MNRTEIAPGVFMTSLPGEKFKRCMISLHFIMEGNREKATAQALLPHVLERRCETIPDPVSLARRLSGLYGAELSSNSFSAGAARVVSMVVSGLKNAYALDGEDLEADYLEIICDLLFRPKLSGGLLQSEDIEIEKEKQADHLRSEMNNKRVYCLRQGRRKLFGDSPLGVESAGYLEDIESLGPEEITAVYREMLATATVEVIVCGANAQPIAKVLADRFARIERCSQMPQVTGVVKPSGKMRRYTEPMDTAQGKLCILSTSGQIPDVHGAAVMRVASAVLGGLPSSRLFLSVREKQSLCYYCTAGYDNLNNLMTMDSGVDHQQAERASQAMLEELRLLQTELVEPEELVYAKLALQNAFLTAKDRPSSIVSWVLSEQLLGSNQTLDQAIQQVESVTREEVRQALASLKPSVEYLITGTEDGANAG